MGCAVVRSASRRSFSASIIPILYQSFPFVPLITRVLSFIKSACGRGTQVRVIFIEIASHGRAGGLALLSL